MRLRYKLLSIWIIGIIIMDFIGLAIFGNKAENWLICLGMIWSFPFIFVGIEFVFSKLKKRKLENKKLNK